MLPNGYCTPSFASCVVRATHSIRREVCMTSYQLSGTIYCYTWYVGVRNQKSEIGNRKSDVKLAAVDGIRRTLLSRLPAGIACVVPRLVCHHFAILRLSTAAVFDHVITELVSTSLCEFEGRRIRTDTGCADVEYR